MIGGLGGGVNSLHGVWVRWLGAFLRPRRFLSISCVLVRCVEGVVMWIWLPQFSVRHVVGLGLGELLVPEKGSHSASLVATGFHLMAVYPCGSTCPILVGGGRAPGNGAGLAG